MGAVDDFQILLKVLRMSVRNRKISSISPESCVTQKCTNKIVWNVFAEHEIFIQAQMSHSSNNRSLTVPKREKYLLIYLFSKNLVFFDKVLFLWFLKQTINIKKKRGKKKTNKLMITLVSWTCLLSNISSSDLESKWWRFSDGDRRLS